MDDFNRIIDFYNMKSNKLKVSFNKQPYYEIFYYVTNNTRDKHTLFKHEYKKCYDMVTNLINRDDIRHVHVKVPEYDFLDMQVFYRRMKEINTDNFDYKLDLQFPSFKQINMVFVVTGSKEKQFSDSVIELYNFLQMIDDVVASSHLVHHYKRYTGCDFENLALYDKARLSSQMFNATCYTYDVYKAIDLQLKMMYFPHIKMQNATVRFAYVPTQEEFENEKLSF